MDCGMTPAGRPEVGKPINLRLGDDLLAQVDIYAVAEGIKRAEAVRRLVTAGLKTDARLRKRMATDGFTP